VPQHLLSVRCLLICGHRRAAAIDRLPACAAILVAGSTVTPWLLLAYLSRFTSSSRLQLSRLKNDSAFRWLGTFLSAFLAFRLLNRRPAKPIPSNIYYPTDLPGRDRTGENQQVTRPRKRSSVSFRSTEAYRAATIPLLAGRTLDLTTFGIVHATVVAASTVVYYIRKARLDSDALHMRRGNVERYIAPAAFITSSFIVMWNWFYSPDRLPLNYVTWIKSAAQIDIRLIEALRQLRFRTFVYGQDTGQRELLGSMARELGFSTDFGDPAKTVPVCLILTNFTQHLSGTRVSVHRGQLGRHIQATRLIFRTRYRANYTTLVRARAANGTPSAGSSELGLSPCVCTSHSTSSCFSVESV